MLVADTTAIAHLHVAGDRHVAAIAAYRRDPDWVTVPLWRYEFVSVLSKHFRAGNLDAASARGCLAQALKLMVPRERLPEAFRPFEIAHDKGITVYDAYFAATAESLQLPLLTEDGELLAKFPGTAISLSAFAAG
jgi:predicted nucleic acid-binding protein